MPKYYPQGASSLGEIMAPVVSWAHECTSPKRHFDRFIRFGMAHQQTHRQTTLQVIINNNNNNTTAPIAVETLGPLNTSACQLFGNLGRKISSSSGDDREGAFSVPKSFGASAALQRCLVT